MRGLARIEIKHVPHNKICSLLLPLVCRVLRFRNLIELIDMSVYDVKGKNAIVTGAGSGIRHFLIKCIQNEQLTWINRYLPRLHPTAS